MIAPIVKRKSCLASNEAIQVQLLVGVLGDICGVRGVAVTARLAVNQRVGVRLSPDTPGGNDEARMTNDEGKHRWCGRCTAASGRQGGSATATPTIVE